GFAEFSGAGIRKQKQLGREKTRSEPSFPVSLVVKLNLGDEIQPKWGRFVTSQNDSPKINYSLKMFSNIFIAELEYFPSIRRPDTKNQISVPTPKSNIV